MTIADTARAAAVDMECKKHGLQQNQDGTWVLKLTVHHEDMPPSLTAACMGTRYKVALVEIGDNEEPVTKAEKPKGGRLAKRAGILCNDMTFRQFLRQRRSTSWETAYCHTHPDDPVATAAKCIRSICGTDSRATLDTDQKAAEIFETIIGEYEAWKRCIEPAA